MVREFFGVIVSDLEQPDKIKHTEARLSSRLKGFINRNGLVVV